MDLIVFSSRGRERYLSHSTPQYLAALASAPLSSRILSIDGMYSDSALNEARDRFDCIVHSTSSSGYFGSIQRAVALVKSDLFFWAEDDFEFGAPPDWPGILSAFAAHPNLVQIRWPRGTVLPIEEKNGGFIEGQSHLWIDSETYRFHPHVARTTYVREVLRSILDGGHPGENLEVAFSRELRRRRAISATFEPEVVRAIHIGDSQGRPGNYYERHQTPQALGDTASSTHPVQQLRQYRSSLIERNRALEFAGKSIFGCAAILGSAICVPFSRQARAFIRFVWSYWRPAYSTPTYLGRTRDDA